MQRLEWIDAVKGTCLLMVIVAHLWSPCPYWIYVLTGGYMQVFFVMAGITAPISSCSFIEHIYKKSKRLIFPYFFYGISLLCVGVLLPTRAEFGKGLLGILYGRYSVFPPEMDIHIPMLQACGFLSPLWFLPCIFLAYVLLAWYDHSKYPYLIIILSIIVGICTPLLPILMPWSIEMAFVGFLLMLGGRVLKPILLPSTNQSNQTFLRQIGLWIGCAAIYILIWKIASPINMSISEMGNSSILFPFRFIFFYLLGICEALFLSLFFRTMQTTFLTKGIAYIGKQALRLLCIHLFIGEGIYYLISSLEWPMIASFSCALTVILLVNYALDKLWNQLDKYLAWGKYL